MAVRLEVFKYSRATLSGTPCVLPLEGPIIWKVPLTEKALFYVINVPAKTSVRPKPDPVIWKVPISKVPIAVARLYLGRMLAYEDNDTQAMQANLKKVQRCWAQISQVLRAENATPRTCGMFYKATVMAVLPNQ